MLIHLLQSLTSNVPVHHQMCNHLGIVPIVTTTATSSAQDFSDLVEYCHGNATTPMGQKRAADGHPATYDVK